MTRAARRSIAALPPPNLHLDTTTAIPHPLSAADADRYRAIFRLQQRGGLAGRRPADRAARAIRGCWATCWRSAICTRPPIGRPIRSCGTGWSSYADLPEAQQIYRLANARMQKGDTPPREPTAVLRRLGTPDSGGEPAEPNWDAGLAAWRVRSMAEAARQFEFVANDETASDWARAAGAYWAARSHLKNHEPGKVSKWMRVAAGYPRTFYGQLARRALGMDSGLAWSKPGVDDGAMQALAQTDGGLRAFALLQIGMNDLAEDELHMLLKADNRAELAPAVLMVAHQAGLPAVSIRLAVQFQKTSNPLRDAALYPVPNWKPAGGFTLDPALLFALMRQESGFNPRAQSAAGAAGLMQLMPATATAVADRPPADRQGQAGAVRSGLESHAGPALCQHAAEGSQRQGRPHDAGDRLQCRAGQSGQVSRQRELRAGSAAVHGEHPRPRDPPVHRARAHQLLALPGLPGAEDADAGRAGERRLADLQGAGREPANGGRRRMARIDETKPFLPVNIAVLTVSDTRTEADDKSGRTLAELIVRDGHRVAARAIVRDDIAAIVAQLKAWIADAAIDVVISTGGTGVTGRDVTPEAFRQVYEKEIEGFGELFRMLSYEKISTSTIQSRATGGVAGGTYLFALPGSPGACRDGWDDILKWQLDSRHRPCNLVELMPRLQEHLKASA